MLHAWTRTPVNTKWTTNTVRFKTPAESPLHEMSLTWAILPWDAVVVWKPLFLHFLHFLWLSHPSLMSSIQISLHFFHNHWLIISLLEAIYLLAFHQLVLRAFWDKENHHWASGRHTLTLPGEWGGMQIRCPCHQKHWVWTVEKEHIEFPPSMHVCYVHVWVHGITKCTPGLV